MRKKQSRVYKLLLFFPPFFFFKERTLLCPRVKRSDLRLWPFKQGLEAGGFLPSGLFAHTLFVLDPHSLPLLLYLLLTHPDYTQTRPERKGGVEGWMAGGMDGWRDGWLEGWMV